MGWCGLDRSGSGYGPLVGSKMLRNSLVAEQLVASQEGFSSMELLLLCLKRQVNFCFLLNKLQ
jgi:hypothetical protein